MKWWHSCVATFDKRLIVIGGRSRTDRQDGSPPVVITETSLEHPVGSSNIPHNLGCGVVLFDLER